MRPVRLDATGLTGPTRGQARGPGWRRTSRGFYVPATVDGARVEQRILEASVVVPPGCAITGWASLRWQGAQWFDGRESSGRPLPVTVLVSTRDIRPQPGILPCGEGTSPGQHLLVDGVPVTAPAWTVAFEMRRATSLARAVSALDMAAYSDLVTLEEVRRVIESQASWTGVPQAREAVDLACENAWSPAEVILRLAWVRDTRFATPLANHPVFDLLGRHLGTPDLVDPRAGVVGEYDGVLHLRREQRVADIHREDAYRRHGLEVVRWASGDSAGRFVARLRAAYGRAERRTFSLSCTTTPPPGWVSTVTVAQRRALSGAQRARLLRYRSNESRAPSADHSAGVLRGDTGDSP